MKQFNNILYVAEPASDQEAAIARAVSLAENNQARLTVLAVLPPLTAGIGMPPGGPITAQLQQRRRDESLQEMEALLAPHRTLQEIGIEVREGRLFQEAVRAVLRDGHDLLIKPAEDPDTISRLFGSDDMHLLRKCPCPVWLTRPGEAANYSNILTALDFTPWEPETIEQPLNIELLELGASLALSDFASLHLAHAWEAFAEELLQHWSDKPAGDTMEYIDAERQHHRAGLEKLAQRLHRELGDESWNYLAPQQHLPRGKALRVIPELATTLRADLVVMGTLGRSGIPGLIIGNTAEAILEQLRCSVLAIKPPGFVSPVTLG